MRKFRLFPFIQLLLFLGGCANPQATAPVQPQATASPQSPVAPVNSAPTPAPQAAPLTLTGKAQVFDQPLAGAIVTVYILGATSPLGSSTAGADGSFSVPLPAEQQGTVYKVVASKGAQTLVSLYQGAPGSQPAGLQVLAAAPSVQLDVTTTLSFEILAPRLEASGKIQLSDAAAGTTVFTVFVSLTKSEGGLLSKSSPQMNLVLSGVDDKGQLKLDNASLFQLGANADPQQLQAFEQAAQQLGQLLQGAAASGQSIDQSLLGGLSFGSVTIQASTTTTSTAAGGGGSGGGGASGPVGTGISAGVAIVPPLLAGTFVPPQGSATSSFKYPIGAVFGTFGVDLQPVAVAVDRQSGHVWVANNSSEDLVELSSAGSFLGSFAVNSPSDMAVDGGGNVWVTAPGWGLNEVVKFSSDGTVLGIYHADGNPTKIALDSGGNAWVTDSGNGNVTELSSTGSVLGSYTVGNGPQGIAVAGNGDVWVANMVDGTIMALSSTGGVIGTFSIGSDPSAVAMDGSGQVWVASNDNNNNVGYVTELSSLGSVLGTFTVGSYPSAMAVDGSGNVWVTNADYSGTVTELSSTGSVLGTYTVGHTPQGIAADGNGYIWVTNYDDGTVTELVD